MTAELPPAAFTSWTTAGGDVAIGRLNDAGVRLTGPLGTASFLDDDYPNFNQLPFTPQLTATGVVEIVSAAGHTFRVDLDELVEDPVLLFGSLASVLTFPPAPWPSGSVATGGSASTRMLSVASSRPRPDRWGDRLQRHRPPAWAILEHHVRAGAAP